MDDPTNMPPASILIVDDDRENLKLVGALLGERGYLIRPLSHGQLALRSAQANPPDLVLLDIRLPDMNGYAVCEALKADADTHDVPVIFCSALGETFDKVRAFAAGAVDYVAKPFDAEEVLARVATHIALRRIRRQLQQQNDQLQQEVAERQRTEAALRQSQALLQAILNNAPSAIAIRDYPGEHYLLANRRLAEVNGFTSEQMLGQPLDGLFSPEAAAQIREEDQRIAESRQSEQSEETLHLPDGREGVFLQDKFPLVDNTGDVYGIGVIFQDITARKQAEAALREQEELFRLTFDLSPIGAAMETLDGRYLRVNDTLCQITGYTREELLGRHFADVTHPEDRNNNVTETQLLIAGKLTEYITEKRYIRKDGRIAWVELSARLMKETAGQPAYILATMVDISARKQAELDLQHANRELRRRIAELSALNQIAEALTQWTDLPAALRAVGATLAGLFDQANLAIWLRDQNGATLSRLAIVAGEQTTMGGPIVALTDDPIASHVLEGGPPKVLAPASQLPPVARPPQLPADGGAGGCMVLPLLSGGETIGLLCVRAAPPGRMYTPTDVALAQTIASSLASAIVNARLFAAEQRQRQAAESLREVTTALTGSLDLETVVGTIFEQLRRVVWYDGAAIFLPDGDALVLWKGAGIAEPHIGHRIPLGETDPTVSVFHNRRPRIIDDTSTSADWVNWDTDYIYLSWMGAPLLIGATTLGVLTTDYAATHAYGAEDLRTLEVFAHQAAIAIENARLFTQAQAAAAEVERRRLARELHDSVTQALFLANLNAEVFPQLWDQDPSRGRRALDDLQQFTRSALAEMRMLLIELRPDALVRTPLHELLQAMGNAVSAKHTLAVDAQMDAVPVLPEEVQIALYRIAQEALNNVVKHAQARRVTLLLQITSPSAASERGESWCDEVMLQIVDDGRGFEVAQVSNGRLGLGGMRERAGGIGASLRIDSEPGAGTHVVVAWRGNTAAAKEQV